MSLEMSKSFFVCWSSPFLFPQPPFPNLPCELPVLDDQWAPIPTLLTIVNRAELGDTSFQLGRTAIGAMYQTFLFSQIRSLQARSKFEELSISISLVADDDFRREALAYLPGVND